MSDSSSIETTELNPENLPLNSLDETVKTISNLLGINSQTIYALEKKLPVIVNPQATLLSGKTAVTLNLDETGQPICTIAFSSPAIMSSSDTTDRRSRTEELLHYLHLAENPILVTEKFRRIQQHREQIKFRGYDAPKSLTYAAGLTQNTQESIIAFFSKIGIKIKYRQTELSPITLKQTLKTLIDKQLLTIEEMYQLYQQLTPQENSTKSEKIQEWISQYTSYCQDIDSIDYGQPLSPQYHRAIDQYKWLSSQKNECASLTYSQLQQRLESFLEGDMNTPLLEQTLETTGISPRSVRFQSQLSRNVLQQLGADELTVTVKHYLATDPTVLDLQTIATQLGASDLAVQLFPFVHGREFLPTDVINSIKQQLMGRVDQAHAQTLRSALESLLTNHLRLAKAKSNFAVATMLFFDDLPADPEARQRLLSSPDYLKLYQQTITKLLQDTLSLSDLDIDRFTRDDNYAQQIVSQVTPQAFANPPALEFSSFTTETQAALADDLLYGDLPEDIEKAAAENLFRKKLQLGNLPGTTIQAQLLDEAVKDTQTNKTLGHDLLMEPIAKVIAAMASDTPIETIKYAVGFIERYSRLLTDQNQNSSLREWHYRLQKFIEKIHRSKNGWKIFQTFLRAGNLEFQQAIISSFIGEK